MTTKGTNILNKCSKLLALKLRVCYNEGAEGERTKMKNSKVVIALKSTIVVIALLMGIFILGTFLWILIIPFRMKDFFHVLSLIIKNGGLYSTLLA